MTYPPDFNYYQPAYSAYDAPAPARRAGTMLLVLGILMASYGLCNAISLFRVPIEELMNQQAQFLPKDQPMPFTAQTLRNAVIAFAIVIVLTGLVLIGLGIPVRRGSRGATIGATVVVGGLVALMLLFMLIGLIAALTAPPAGILMCVMVIPLALFALQFVWLIQAARAPRSAPQWDQAYAAQYWQYYQQQQQQQGYPAGPYTPPAAPPPQYFPPPQPPQQQQPPQQNPPEAP